MRLTFERAPQGFPSVLGLLLCLVLSSCAGSGARTNHQIPGGSGDLPFSHVVQVGDTVYVAGTLGRDGATGLPPADAGEEARLVLDGIRAKLELVGLTMDDLVSVQVFCSDVELYGVFNDVYRTYFDGAFPTRSFIGSGELLFGCHFEVNGIAVRP